MFKLTLRAPASVPLELDGVTPERVAGLSALKVAKIPVAYCNRTEPLCEFFAVSPRTVPTADIQFAGDTQNVKGIGAGMTSGFVYVENSVGMHAGARMTGGSIVIDSGAGDWLGAERRGGSIEVRGSAGSQVGAAYRGSRRGMSGGSIFIRGSAGDELGLLMRRGVIVVGGDCGEFAGASMIAGTIAVFGTTGPRLGAGMKRGTILAARAPDLPASFRLACEYRPSVLHLLNAEVARLGSSHRFPAQAVRCFRGDLLTGGRGEILVPV